MLLNVLNHRCPVSSLLLIDVPALYGHVCASLCQDSRVVHHFLRDATNVYTCSSESPLCANGCRWDKVGECGTIRSIAHLSTVTCTGYATTSTANNENIKVVLVFFGFFHCCICCCGGRLGNWSTPEVSHSLRVVCLNHLDGINLLKNQILITGHNF